MLAYRVRRGIDELVMLAGATFGALIIATFAQRSVFAGFSIAASLYMVGIAVIFAKPRMGVYFLIFFTLAGEPFAMPWWPFTKGGSAAESVLFIDDRLVASPFEGYIIVTFVAMVLHRLRSGEAFRVATPFTIPTILFAGGTAIGVLWGAATCGVLALAINQTRAILVIPLVYLIGINLLDRTSIRPVLWSIITAVLVETGFSLYFIFSVLSPSDRADLFESGDSPIAHFIAVQMNVVFFLLAAVMLLRKSSLALRIALPILIVPIGVVYIIAERRSAIGGLLIAGALLMYVLSRRQPGRFWAIGPAAGVLLTGYCAAFWNSTSSAGFPAQAIKSQIVSDQASGADSSSDLYRAAENWNLVFTLKSDPLLGIGYGKPFPTPIPLQDISDAFPLWQYFPHNSLLGLWAFGGALSIAAWLYLTFAGVRGGVRASLDARGPDDVLTAVSGLGIVAMVAIYSYVDITFDQQTMLLFAIGLVLIDVATKTNKLDDEAEALAPPDEIELGESDARRKRGNVGV
ncbi:MAG: O-antigen ligase family protein [Actinomycetota bacterium]